MEFIELLDLQEQKMREAGMLHSDSRWDSAVCYMYHEDFDESLHPRAKNGQFTEGSGALTASGNTGNIKGRLPSAKGANSLNKKSFRSPKILDEHWKKHGKEFEADGIKTKEEYQKRAISLLESATSDTILGHINHDNQIVRYDKANNFFVKGQLNRGVFTMFKPTRGEAYYKDQEKKDE